MGFNAVCSALISVELCNSFRGTTTLEMLHARCHRPHGPLGVESAPEALFFSTRANAAAATKRTAPNQNIGSLVATVNKTIGRIIGDGESDKRMAKNASMAKRRNMMAIPTSAISLR